MSLLKDLKPPPRKSAICKVWVIRELLDAADQKILDAALADLEAWPHETLMRELRKRGLEIGRETIRHHRRGDCVCVSR